MSDTGIPKQYEYDSFDGYVDALEEFARVANKERNDALQLARELLDALTDIAHRADTGCSHHYIKNLAGAATVKANQILK